MFAEKPPPSRGGLGGGNIRIYVLKTYFTSYHLLTTKVAVTESPKSQVTVMGDTFD